MPVRLINLHHKITITLPNNISCTCSYCNKILLLNRFHIYFIESIIFKEIKLSNRLQTSDKFVRGAFILFIISNN
jgi:hypothetical protein